MNDTEKEGFDEEKIYRINFISTNAIEVKTYGIKESHNELELSYDSVDKLPIWVQKKIALLSMIDLAETNLDVPKVGRRITENVYWVYPD